MNNSFDTRVLGLRGFALPNQFLLEDLNANLQLHVEDGSTQQISFYLKTVIREADLGPGDCLYVCIADFHYQYEPQSDFLKMAYPSRDVGTQYLLMIVRPQGYSNLTYNVLDCRWQEI